MSVAANEPVSSVLAFDYGRRRIGVAIGNGLTRSGEPLTTLLAANDDTRFAQIKPLILQWQPDCLVVGRPLHPDGAMHEMTHACERFARQLRGRFRLKVALVDERYSSVAAQSVLAQTYPARANRAARDAGGVDAMAAAIILRQYWSDHFPDSDSLLT